MTKTKYRYFATIEKEEEWLNNCLNQNLKLIGPVGYGQYRFKKVQSNNEVIRVDVRKFKKINDKEEYLQFMEDAGWRSIKSREKDGKQYFIGNKTNGDELFSDNQSKYEREVRAEKRLAATNSILIVYYILFFNQPNGWAIIKNMRNAFYTEDLWNMNGKSFINAFLFELPFATVRIILVFGPFLLLAYFLYQSYTIRKSINTYKRLIKDE